MSAEYQAEKNKYKSGTSISIDLRGNSWKTNIKLGWIQEQCLDKVTLDPSEGSFSLKFFRGICIHKTTVVNVCMVSLFLTLNLILNVI